LNEMKCIESLFSKKKDGEHVNGEDLYPFSTGSLLTYARSTW